MPPLKKLTLFKVPAIHTKIKLTLNQVENFIQTTVEIDKKSYNILEKIEPGFIEKITRAVSQRLEHCDPAQRSLPIYLVNQVKINNFSHRTAAVVSFENAAAMVYNEIRHLEALLPAASYTCSVM